MAIVAPSILTCDFLNLKEDLKKLETAGVEMLHLDVMDGIFVPNITFGASFIKSVRKYTNMQLDTHLMIDRPHRYIEEFAKYTDWLGFHYEAGSDNEETLKKIKSFGIKSCITIKPNTSAEAIFNLLPLCDMVLVMSVEPGFGGQKFIESAYGKITALKAEIKRQGLNTLVEVDGGINKETAPKAVKAGVDVLVAGSYVFNSEDMHSTVNYLKQL